MRENIGLSVIIKNINKFMQWRRNLWCSSIDVIIKQPQIYHYIIDINKTTIRICSYNWKGTLCVFYYFKSIWLWLVFKNISLKQNVNCTSYRTFLELKVF